MAVAGDIMDARYRNTTGIYHFRGDVSAFARHASSLQATALQCLHVVSRHTRPQSREVSRTNRVLVFTKTSLYSQKTTSNDSGAWIARTWSIVKAVFPAISSDISRQSHLLEM